MAKTIDGITFKNLSRIGTGSSFGNLKMDGITSEDDLQDFIQADEEYRNIQSVLIDWNDADWPSATAAIPSTIRTTGDLISAIKYASTVGGGSSLDDVSVDSLYWGNNKKITVTSFSYEQTNESINSIDDLLHTISLVSDTAYDLYASNAQEIKTIKDQGSGNSNPAREFIQYGMYPLENVVRGLETNEKYITIPVYINGFVKFDKNKTLVNTENTISGASSPSSILMDIDIPAVGTSCLINNKTFYRYDITLRYNGNSYQYLSGNNNQSAYTIFAYCWWEKSYFNATTSNGSTYAYINVLDLLGVTFNPITPYTPEAPTTPTASPTSTTKP